MKKILFVFMVIALFGSCSTDDENGQNSSISYLTDYKYGNEYTQQFYSGGNFIFASHGYVGHGCYIYSSCGRLSFTLIDTMQVYDKIAPPLELNNKVTTLNNESNSKDLQYYLVANIHFKYPISVNELDLTDKWRIVIGRKEEYVFKDEIYERLVVVE